MWLENITTIKQSNKPVEEVRVWTEIRDEHQELIVVGGYVRLKKAKFDRNLSLQWTVFVGRAISCEVFLG